MAGYDLDVLAALYAWDRWAALQDGGANLELLDGWYPVVVLMGAGLVGEDGRPTGAWADAKAEALVRLPSELTDAAKLDLLTHLFELCVADGIMERDEGSTLFSAATDLGVSSSDLDAHLDTLTDHVGEIDLDVLEPES
jgi:hypothetical protein